MPNEKQSPKELKVTDKRIFTPEGRIRDEFKQEIDENAAPAALDQDRSSAAPPSEPKAAPAEPPAAAPAGKSEKRSRTVAERGTNPGTPFANFVQSLVMQAYMFLGMLRDPRASQPMFDAAAARETIDILVMLQEKTANNLTEEETDFLEAHLSELKLAFVQRTKSI